MKFLFPEFLWALTVLIIPIIIHLFNFKKYKTLYFSSLSFIKHVDQKTKSTQRLKHLLILLSRVLAFILLVFAFAQPYFSDGTEGLNSKNTITCFYIDNSFSMQARGPEGELLSEAREKAKELVESTPMETRFLIGTNEMSGREERILNRMEALEKLDKIELSPLSRSISEVEQWQREILKKTQEAEEGQTKINYFIFSDFQRTKNPVIKKSESNIWYYPTRLIAEKQGNIYVDSAWFTSPIHKAGKANELNIRVVNKSDEHIENLEVTADIGKYNKTIFINAPANQTTTTSVTYTDKTTGYKSGKITVVDEHVFFDDSYFLSYEVQERTNVLILNGADAIAGTKLVYDLDDYYVSKQKEITSVTKEDFAEQDLIIFNGANKMSSGIANYLVEFTKSGGSVALFPGREPEKNEWNQLLSVLKLPKIGNTVRSGNKIKSLNYADPFYTGVFEKETQDLNLPSVSKTFRAIPSNTRSVNLITLQNGLPLFSYVQKEGNVFMFYSAIHEAFGNFSHDALFTTILFRMGELSKRKHPLSLTIGSSSQYPIYTSISGDKAIHVVSDHFDFIPQSTEISGVNYISLNKLDNYSQLTAGNYSIESDEDLGVLSLNYNRSESNLSYFTPEEITTLFSENIATYNEISSQSQLSTIDIDKPFSFWKFCIVFTLIFVAAEMLLVRFLK